MKDGEAILRAAFVLQDDLGEPVRCAIAGNCMAPWIVDGDELLVDHDVARPRVGQIVLFLDSGSLFVHRVVAIGTGADGRERFVLAADGTRVVRPPITRDRIVGRVVEVDGAAGRFRFDRPVWRIAGRALAWRLSLTQRARERRGRAGRLLASAVRLRRVLFPERWSLTTAPIEWMVAVHRVWGRRKSDNKGGDPWNDRRRTPGS